MAFPFKTGGDFYNCEAQRMALHNLGANPTETATGLMYFNTGTSNLGKHAVVHDGTNFKALAFVDEIATNAEFVGLKEKVDLLIGDDVDTDTIIDSWKEVQAFLADIEDTKTLQGMLSSYLPKSGGTITGEVTISGGGTYAAPLIIKTPAMGSSGYIQFTDGSSELGWIGFSNKTAVIRQGGENYALLHSRNYSDYALPLSGGTISNANYAPLTIHRDKTDYDSAIKFSNVTNGVLGYIGFKGDTKVPYYSPDGTTINTLLHSGNIGDYAPLRRTRHNTIDLNAASNGFYEIGYSGQTITNAPSDYNSGASLLMDFRDANGYAKIQFLGKNDSAGLWFRAQQGAGSEITSAWKQIAFTDSTVAAANVLRTTTGIPYVYAYNTDKIFVFGESAAANGYKTYVDGISISLRYGGSTTTGLILNSSGNVTIGGSDLAGTGAKLWVSGGTTLNINYHLINNINQNPTKASEINRGTTLSLLRSNDKKYGLHFWIGGNATSYIQSSYADNANDNVYPISINPLGGNVLIGTPTEIKNGAKLQVKGDLYVDGNIIATKEVAAGGAGQEGESGDGGAEVIAQPLAKGQSTYTITNTIGRSDIAVSLYEWNANNESWDMCLADISVKDATITITFGSATSVNHKIVAVG